MSTALMQGYSGLYSEYKEKRRYIKTQMQRLNLLQVKNSIVDGIGF
jgi:hypothetical protein